MHASRLFAIRQELGIREATCAIMTIDEWLQRHLHFSTSLDLHQTIYAVSELPQPAMTSYRDQESTTVYINKNVPPSKPCSHQGADTTVQIVCLNAGVSTAHISV